MDVAREVMEVVRGYRVLVVPGGGPFADAVRRAYDTCGLSERAAHRMAILAMDLYGVLLSDVSGVPTTRDPLETCLPAVLLPSGCLEDDPFEPSWEVTSDTIAAHVARLRGEGGLLLLKSAEGPEVVDRVLPSYLERHGMACRVVNAREIEALASVLAGAGLEKI